MAAFVFKSHWQKTKILEKFPNLPPEKAFVIYNGIKAKSFEYLSQTPIPHRFIHASTWYRGVLNFIDIWPRILDKYSDAEIHVFSKTELYSECNSGDQRWRAITEALCKLPGMVLREPVPQWILAQEMRKAWLMLYPNTGFVESSCGAALQSLAAGTPVIATKRAGLIETVGDFGHLVEERPGWQNQFAEKTIELCENENRRNFLGKLAREAVLQQSWAHQAKKWGQFLGTL
jgi:glycosyltransferase involved in cell wall biosynthesis